MRGLCWEGLYYLPSAGMRQSSGKGPLKGWVEDDLFHSPLGINLLTEGRAGGGWEETRAGHGGSRN